MHLSVGSCCGRASTSVGCKHTGFESGWPAFGTYAGPQNRADRTCAADRDHDGISEYSPNIKLSRT
eukprot:6455069-Amphidinium_carterae.1